MVSCVVDPARLHASAGHSGVQTVMSNDSSLDVKRADVVTHKVTHGQRRGCVNEEGSDKHAAQRQFGMVPLIGQLSNGHLATIVDEISSSSVKATTTPGSAPSGTLTGTFVGRCHGDYVRRPTCLILMDCEASSTS